MDWPLPSRFSNAAASAAASSFSPSKLLFQMEAAVVSSAFSFSSTLSPPPHLSSASAARSVRRLIQSVSTSLRRSSSSYSSLMAATPLQVSASSTLGATDETLSVPTSGSIGHHDLLIVGPGVLGRLVALKWREEYPDSQIAGQTVTTTHHDELVQIGITPLLKGVAPTHKYPFIIFCAPPYQTADYPGDVRTALSSWNGDGCFLFTSSSAPYDCNDNGSCNEDSPVVPIGKSPRTDVLLKAEQIVLEAGGCVVRLAGLYNENKGAHVYWLEKGTLDVCPDHILNLIHYEDAASLSIAILKKNLRGRIFLGCDNHPVSRQDVMDLVSKSGKFSKKFVGFTGTNDPLGKRLNNTKTREELGWEPKYRSFADFLGVTE